MMPNLAQNSLLSARKFVDAKYVTVLTPEEVLMFEYLGDLQLTIFQEAILKGWRCKTSGFWRVPLNPMVINQNKDTILLDRPNPEHAVNSAYELPITEQLIRYLHACAGYPKKETWFKAVRSGNYVSWPGLNVKKVNIHYPDTYKTLKSHMQQVRLGIISTKETVTVASDKNEKIPRRK